ncbi:MAG: 4-hydroxy-tetrahydrodipicolinate synthase [Lentisphaerae bacterium]|nr:4-hydroxy-tetrahydrodipicolinate synthase [Lentisphaerota bacterium]
MFQGAYTALVTPFTTAGSVDYARLKNLIELQIEAGVDGITPVGTTGESPTLDMAEHKKVIEVSVETVHGRIQVVAGTGANSTAEAVELTEHAIKVGADATLQVTPYYNKPNQEGLIRHFSKVADLGLPVVLYNVPGRAGQEIAVETVVKLRSHPKILAIKEAAGSVERVCRILNSCSITVLSGDDALTLPMMIVGAKGVVSVASNVAPKAIAEMVHFALNGNWEEARKLHMNYYGLMADLFLDTNPIPVKAAMAMMGLIEEVYRLPLSPLGPRLKEKLLETLAHLKLIKS